MDAFSNNYCSWIYERNSMAPGTRTRTLAHTHTQTNAHTHLWCNGTKSINVAQKSALFINLDLPCINYRPFAWNREHTLQHQQNLVWWVITRDCSQLKSSAFPICASFFMLWSLGPKILTHSFQQFLTFFIELALSFSHELDEEILEPVTTLFPLLGSIHNSSLALFCLHHPTICSTIYTGFHYPPPAKLCNLPSPISFASHRR
jgi:hypothetical protein